jgi:hypothetical protein
MEDLWNVDRTVVCSAQTRLTHNSRRKRLTDREKNIERKPLSYFCYRRLSLCKGREAQGISSGQVHCELGQQQCLSQRQIESHQRYMQSWKFIYTSPRVCRETLTHRQPCFRCFHCSHGIMASAVHTAYCSSILWCGDAPYFYPALLHCSC